ncbi:hypothetical protein BCR44DRAFT_78469 [Catenaria anguillulae PL171]|uniref:Signal peptidase complex catalytic subunit SEC11 n=1 Tax=Catenaria anguillulae PL171 TaxID=765915 RepID=A0A1Y2HZG8_9FUNG|nr:hypothetical protein BCR44DRAFT_78469 [Catenaria anguillulae PL171]
MQLLTLSTSHRRIFQQALSLLLFISTVLVDFKGATVTLNTEAPVVVVLTESMEPAFSRGDLLFLHNPNRALNVGDIIVYKLENKKIPIVHRILQVHSNTETGDQHFLTKGDYNKADDRGIYAESQPGKLWLTRSEVVGVVKGYVPYVGYLTIFMNENPYAKYAMLGGLALVTLIQGN